MEYLRLKGISRRVRIGLGSEKLKMVRIVVDVEMGVDAGEIGKTDDLSKGIDYRELHKEVFEEMDGEYTTIEALGYRIFLRIKDKFNPGHLSVIVKKPYPPLEGEVESAEVEFRL